MPLMLVDCTHNYENQTLDAQSQEVKKEQVQPPIVDTVTDSGGAKAEDGGLFLLDSPGHTVDSLTAYDSIIEPLAATPTSSSSSSCLSYPSFGTNTLLPTDTLSDEILSTIVNISPNFIPHNASTLKELGMPCSSQPLVDSRQVTPQLESLVFPLEQCSPAGEQGFFPKGALNYLPNLPTFLLNKPGYEQHLPPCTRADSFTYPLMQRCCSKEAAKNVASPRASLHLQPMHEQQMSMAAMNQQKGQVLHGLSYVTPDDFNTNGIVPQDSIGNFFEGGCPKTTYVLTDCSDVIGSRRQHHPLLQSRLSVLQAPGHLPSIPRYHSYNNLDARECLPHQHAAKIDDFLLSSGPSIMYSKPKVEPTSLYAPEDLQDDRDLHNKHVVSPGSKSCWN